MHSSPSVIHTHERTIQELNLSPWSQDEGCDHHTMARQKSSEKFIHGLQEGKNWGPISRLRSHNTTRSNSLGEVNH